MKQVNNVAVLNIQYVRKDKWCEYVGYPIRSIDKAIESGELLRGKHYILQKRRILLNLEEMNRWLLSNEKLLKV